MSPIQRGLAAGGAVLAATLALSWAFGWRGGSGPFAWRFWLSAESWLEALQAALIGYGVAVPGLLREGARRALRELGAASAPDGGEPAGPPSSSARSGSCSAERMLSPAPRPAARRARRSPTRP